MLYARSGIWVIMGFGWTIGFIGSFDIARDYSLQFTIIYTLPPTVTFSQPLLGSGIQRRTLLFLLFPNCLWPKLPISYNAIGLKLNLNRPLINSLTHQTTKSELKLCYDRWSVGQSFLISGSSGAHDQIRCEIVVVGHTLSDERTCL
jgi:hypothetical protein